ncbi:type I polyketide synthase [Paenibacillus lutimineralis]|uniref:SDR family NAD(P)-dependent oxidoreductase n=1 Tax=Paenibacillus lutimineralis TaxID=2707005 RepID=A0A3S9UVB2_9BACL|nr:type I polyketide synthase [Paenibacillus lutimineralis]AZS14161.1 SDR family NAD(P)-dependent oxidoreductase [Paenibacillus lutimineralis]
MSLGKADGHKEIIYFQEQWADSAPAPQNEAAARPLGVLLLVVESDTPESWRTVDALTSDFTVVSVHLGASYLREGERCYKVNRNLESDYAAMLAEVITSFPKIDSVVMLWDQELPAGRNTDGALSSVFYLIKAFHALKLRLNNRWLSLSTSGGERLDVEALGALGKSLERVYPRLRFTHAEVPGDGSKVADILRGELLQDSYAFSHEVRYEQGIRKEKQLREVVLSRECILLKPGGVYIISGGAGSLGMILAGHLARTYKARLMLLGRSTQDSALEAKLDTLRAMGAQAEYLACDVSDPLQAQQAVQQAKRCFGDIHGVVHAAGKASSKLIFQKQAHEFSGILQPKIGGVLALDEATKAEALDFFIVFSSTSSLIGDFGQGDYAVANRYLDRFCERRDRRVDQGQRSGRSISIQWPLWKTGGMHLDSGAEQLYLQASGIGQLEAEQGIVCFEAVMAGGFPQTAVIYGERAKLELQLMLAKPTEHSQVKGGATELDKHGQQRSIESGLSRVILVEERVRRDVLRLAAEVLQTQTSKLDMDENMGDFGFDSISLKEYADALCELYGIELSPAVFFAKTTLKELANFLLDEDFSEEVAAYYAAEEGPEQAFIESPAEEGVAEKSSFTEQPEPSPPSQTPALQPLSQKYPERKKTGMVPTSVQTTRDVAVVGISFKLPGADTAEELWGLLDRRENHVREVPDDRWDWKAYYSPDAQEDNKTNSRWGGFISGHDHFDAKFFQISPREAELMDPQQRLFIQAVWRAVEDSGYKMSELSGKRVGVFAGVQFSDYQQLLSANMEKVHAQSSIGNATALLSNRVSYLFNFNGPSESIDTACSSSLVALHRAVKSIQQGESELALAGGVSLMLDPNTYVGAGVMGVFSPDGQCKTFDRSANGYVKGEGVGVVVLKPLEKAVGDGDYIYGVVKGTAVNHGGRAHSLTAPNSDAQAELLLEAYTEAGVDPATVSYIETHGTGTELGDPVEVGGLKKAFSELYRRWDKDPGSGQPIGLGALKTNIGHLEPASGIAGFIKTLLALEKKKLPGNVHFKELNPYIQLEGTPFYVLDTTREWVATRDESGEAQPRCAGVSSFGFGGANAHAVIQEYLPRRSVPLSGTVQEPKLFVLSAKNEGRLREYAFQLLDYLGKSKPDLCRLAYTLQMGREDMEERLAAAASDVEELRLKLTAYCEGRQADGLYTGSVKQRRAGNIETVVNASEVRKALSLNDIPALAKAWMAGQRINWEELYSGRPLRIAGLPTYPFAETRYWMPQKEKPFFETAADSGRSSVPCLQVLIGRNVSTLYEQAFETDFHGSEFYLADHGHVLPGVVYLEMLRAAGEMADPGRQVCVIRNVIWSNPVIVEAKVRTVRTVLQAGPQGIDFRICSKQDGQIASHAQGRLEMGSTLAGATEKLDIGALIARYRGGESDARAYYELIGRLGAELGERFQGIQALHCGSEEAITKLAVLASLNPTLGQFGLHPTLTDGGLQSAVAFAYKTGRIDQNVLYVPFVLGQLEIFDVSAKPAYAHVKPSEAKGLKFDISYLGAGGEVLARMKELTIRPFQASVVQSALESESDVPKELVYFMPKWVPSPINSPALDQGEDSRLVLVNVSGGEFAALGTFDSGAPVHIEWGQKYQKLEAGRFQINPNADDAFNKWGSECSITGETRLRIVYILRQPGEETLKERIRREIYPLFQLCKWLVSWRFKHEVRICCIYQGGQAISEYNALAGFFHSLVLEQPKLLGSVIHCKGIADLDRLLMEELAGTGAHEVKYEDGRRYARQLVPAEPTLKPEQKLIQRGAYLIVGGMGGLGYIFAKYLAAFFQARLVLCGRSTHCDGEKLDELRGLGAEAMYIPMDLADPASVDGAVRTAKAAYSGLNGVFHCAGVVRDSLWAKKDMAEVEMVLNSKVYGTAHLYETLSREELELFVPFSSSTSLIGNIGQGDYAYANSFLDHYVASMNEQLGRSDTVLNWSVWQNGGMQIDAATRELLWNKFGMRPLTDEEGIAAFEQSLALGEQQILVAAGDRAKLIYAFTRPVLKESVRLKAHPVTAAAAGRDLISRLADELIGIMADILKSDRGEIATDSDLSELGFDSISFTELSNAINRAFSVDITPTLFFEQSSPLTIAEAVYGEYGVVIDRYFEAEEALPTQTANAEAPFVAKHWQKVLADNSQNAFRTMLPTLVNEAVSELVHSDRGGNGSLLELTSSRPASAREPIAIIGMSGMMPGADNLEQFWENLEAKRDMVTDIPADRWSWQDRYGDPRTETGRTDVKSGAFLNEIDTFDPLFFGISPMEAEKMDPQERHMLQIVWHTLENAGYKADALAGTRTSVFIGVSNGDYQELLLKDEIATTLTRTMLTNRISYFFNWSGPSEPVDTACSSSLVAIHRAAESIWHDECTYAVAGGINLISSPNLFIAGSSLGMLSKDGKCKTFDKSADGYVRGEGAGALLLKPLSAAIRDKDYIHGVIRGTAVNHGGKSNSITSPNAKSQADVIVQAHARAGVDPATITYIETHGTGTSLGDPIEVDGLKKAFKTLFRAWDKPDSELPQCVLGSVKTNIGHLESAAGMSSIFKVLLSMKHKKIPGNLYFNELNPYIKLEGTGLRIAEETVAWKALSDEHGSEIPRRSGISSFGVGGSNAHIIIEEYRNDPFVLPTSNRSKSLIILSAKSHSSLLENSRRLQAFAARSLSRSITASEAAADLEAALRQETASLFGNMMGIEPENIDPYVALEEYGLDAVKNVQLLEALKEKYHLEFKDSLYGFSSLNSLVMFLLQHDPEGIAEFYAGMPSHGAEQTHVDAFPVTLEQIAYGLQTGRSEFAERAAFVVDSLVGLHVLLEAYISGNRDMPGIYEGRSNARSALGKLFDGEESRLFMNELMQAGKLDKIAQLWVQGVSVDWSAWYSKDVHKTPLPEYAFDRERYWLPGPDRPPGNAVRKEHSESPLYNEASQHAPEGGAFQAAVDHDSQEGRVSLNDEQILMWLTKVQKGEISAENLNLLVGDLLE